MKEKYTDNDLNGLGDIAQSLHVNPFTVPDHYFKALNHRTLQRCRHVDASAAWAVPAGYFDQLRDGILSRITEEKLRNKVRESGFTVPTGYFDASQAAILNKAFPKTAVKHERQTIRVKWWQYAAAACLATILSISGYIELADRQTSGHSLEAVSDQEILSYLELYGEPSDISYITEYLNDQDVDIETGLNQLSDDDIEAYLNNTL